MDADHVQNGTAPICTLRAQPPTITSLTQAGNQLGTQLTARHGVKRGLVKPLRFSSRLIQLGARCGPRAITRSVQPCSRLNWISVRSSQLKCL